MASPAANFGWFNGNAAFGGRNSLFGHHITLDAINKFNVQITERCLKRQSIPTIGSFGQTDDKDLLKLCAAMLAANRDCQSCKAKIKKNLTYAQSRVVNIVERTIALLRKAPAAGRKGLLVGDGKEEYERAGRKGDEPHRAP